MGCFGLNMWGDGRVKGGEFNAIYVRARSVLFNGGGRDTKREWRCVPE